MSLTRKRRPGQEAALGRQTETSGSTAANLAETPGHPQLLGLADFWIGAGGLVKCAIIRRSDGRLRLAAEASLDKTAITFEHGRKDWISHIADRRPLCLACDVAFSPRSLPADWAMLSPLEDFPTTPAAMLSGICARCSGKSDRELMDAALRDLRATVPGIRRVVATGAGRA